MAYYKSLYKWVVNKYISLYKANPYNPYYNSYNPYMGSIIPYIQQITKGSPWVTAHLMTPTNPSPFTSAARNLQGTGASGRDAAVACLCHRVMAKLRENPAKS